MGRNGALARRGRPLRPCRPVHHVSLPHLFQRRAQGSARVPAAGGGVEGLKHAQQGGPALGAAAAHRPGSTRRHRSTTRGCGVAAKQSEGGPPSLLKSRLLAQTCVCRGGVREEGFRLGQQRVTQRAQSGRLAFCQLVRPCAAGKDLAGVGVGVGTFVDVAGVGGRREGSRFGGAEDWAGPRAGGACRPAPAPPPSFSRQKLHGDVDRQASPVVFQGAQGGVQGGGAGGRGGVGGGGGGGGRHVGIASAARGAPHAPSPTPPLPHMRWVRASPSPSKVARDASISCTWGGRAGVGAARRVGDCTAPPTRPQGARTVGGVANDGGAGRVRRCGARSPARPATSGACDARGGRRSPERGRARPRGPCSCHARAQHHPPSTGRLLDRRAEPYGRRPCPT